TGPTGSSGFTGVTGPTGPTGFGSTGSVFLAYNTGNTSVATTGAYNRVPFSYVQYDTQNAFANSRFTPTVSGYYHISWNAYLQNAAFVSTASPIASLFKNSAIIGQGSTVSGNA